MTNPLQAEPAVLRSMLRASLLSWAKRPYSWVILVEPVLLALMVVESLLVVPRMQLGHAVAPTLLSWGSLHGLTAMIALMAIPMTFLFTSKARGQSLSAQTAAAAMAYGPGIPGWVHYALRLDEGRPILFYVPLVMIALHPDPRATTLVPGLVMALVGIFAAIQAAGRAMVLQLPAETWKVPALLAAACLMWIPTPYACGMALGALLLGEILYLAHLHVCWIRHARTAAE